MASGLSACLNVDGTRYAASLYPAGLRAEADTAALAVGGRRVGTRPGQPCPAAYARWRLAEALLVARMDHERAEGAVRDAGTLGSGGRRFQFGTRAFVAPYGGLRDQRGTRPAWRQSAPPSAPDGD